jgi:hypothetical protein
VLRGTAQTKDAGAGIWWEKEDTALPVWKVTSHTGGLEAGCEREKEAWVSQSFQPKPTEEWNFHQWS